MTTPLTNKDDPNIEFREYPSGARFIGPGDDVVISAAKLEAFIEVERLKAEKVGLERTNKWTLNASLNHASRTKWERYYTDRLTEINAALKAAGGQDE